MAHQNNIELTNLEMVRLENTKINYGIAMERYRIGDLSGAVILSIFWSRTVISLERSQSDLLFINSMVAFIPSS